MSATPEREPEPRAPRRSLAEKRRLLAVAILTALATLFAVLNLDEVEVELIAASPRLPLVVVIVGCLLVGYVLGRLLGRRARH